MKNQGMGVRADLDCDKPAGRELRIIPADWKVYFKRTREPLGKDRREDKTGFADEALPHIDAVYRFSLRLCQGRESDADDLVQQTFMKAHRSWHTYQRGTECRSWLFTICRNEFLKHEGRKGRKHEIPTSQIDADVESLAATAVFSAVQNADPEKEFFDAFVDEEVLAAIDRRGDARVRRAGGERALSASMPAEAATSR